MLGFRVKGSVLGLRVSMILLASEGRESLNSITRVYVVCITPETRTLSHR